MSNTLLEAGDTTSNSIKCLRQHEFGAGGGDYFLVRVSDDTVVEAIRKPQGSSA
jgi:hypothetical protein